MDETKQKEGSQTPNEMKFINHTNKIQPVGILKFWSFLVFLVQQVEDVLQEVVILIVVRKQGVNQYEE